LTYQDPVKKRDDANILHSILNSKRLSQIEGDLFNEIIRWLSVEDEDINFLSMAVLNEYIKFNLPYTTNLDAKPMGFFKELCRMGDINDIALDNIRTITEEYPGVSDGLFSMPRSAMVQSDTFVNQPPSNQIVSRTTLIMHGTWALKTDWWKPKGNFYEYINPMCNFTAHPFSWSGKNKHDARKVATEDLKSYVENHVKTEEVDIYAHSHGGNVALLATRLGMKVRKLVLMGTPIRLNYTPDMRKIDLLFNVYSTSDSIQRLGSAFNRRGEGRTLSDTDKILNCLADNDGMGGNPWHSELHSSPVWTASKQLAEIINS
jgi:pimeloyl-ACP methyl ester carboxylesterase